MLQGSVRGTTTNSNGEYHLQGLASGEQTLSFSMVGYKRELRTITIRDYQETSLELSLMVAPVQTEQVVVTASKRQQSLQEVPVSISVLDATAIEERNSVTIEEALRYVPGVNLTGSQVNIRGSSGYSRGAGTRVLLLLDGVPFIPGDSGELSFESIPAGQVDHIEVVKGASSALYGSNALGGVINVITKPIPAAETIVRTYGGYFNNPSHDQWKWSDHARFVHGASISHARKSGDLGMVVFASQQRDEGYRQNDARTRYNIFVKAKEEFSALNSLTMTFGLLYQYGGQYLYWRNLDSALIPPAAQISDNIKSIRYYANALYNDVLSNSTLLTVKALWYHNDWGFETVHQIGRNESISDALESEAGLTIALNRVHTLTFGINGRLDIVNADLFGIHSGVGAALYAQDELRLQENLTFTIGMRYDYRSMGLVKPSGQVNPKAAVLFSPGEGTTIRASVGRGFRMPSVAESFLTGEVSGLAAVPNTELKPERSLSVEAGVSQMLGSWGTFDFAAFRSDYQDLIEAGLVVSSDNLPYIQWRNVTRARVRGVESSLGVGLFGGALLANFGYTYVYPEDLTTGDLLKYRPRHLFYANLLVRSGWGFFAGADFRYISRVDRIDEELVDLGIVPDGDERVPIYVTDVRVGADLTLGGTVLTTTLNINNIFQHNYVELIGNLMPPRTYVLSVQAKL